MQCILCGHAGATGTPTDYGNRTAISCPSEACGSYEISKRAEAELLSDPDRRQSLQDAVLSAKGLGVSYEILFENGVLVGRPVPMERK